MWTPTSTRSPTGKPLPSVMSTTRGLSGTEQPYVLLACAIESKLLDLRDMCEDDAPAFWGFLSRLEQLHQECEDDTRLPLGAFWKSLLPSLEEAPIVLTESGKWLVPKLTRIPTGPEEEAAVAAFEELGIELVNRELWREHRNLLTRGDVGGSPHQWTGPVSAA